MCEMSWDIVCLCKSCPYCDLTHLSSVRIALHVLCRAVFKRFIIYNNNYFECFQALNFDNLVESKLQLCNNEIKLVFKINEYLL